MISISILIVLTVAALTLFLRPGPPPSVAAEAIHPEPTLAARSAPPALPPTTLIVVPRPRRAALALGPGWRTFRLRVSGTLRLGVAHPSSRDQELRVGREGRLVGRPDERLRVLLLRERDLVVHASEDQGFVESVLRLQRAWAALERLLPSAAPRTLEVGHDGVTLLADDELSPDQQDEALLDLAEVLRSLATVSGALTLAGDPPPPAPLSVRSGDLRQTRPSRTIVVGSGRLTARSRAAGPRRCAFCHDALDDVPALCPSCDTAVHDECALELGRCPTAGCHEPRRQEAA